MKQTTRVGCLFLVLLLVGIAGCEIEEEESTGGGGTPDTGPVGPDAGTNPDGGPGTTGDDGGGGTDGATSDGGGIPTYTTEIQALFTGYGCSDCHSVGARPGMSFATNYSDNLEDATYTSCAGMTIAACALQRATEGTMPPPPTCSEPQIEDRDSEDCMSEVELALIGAWIDGGTLE